MSPIFADNASWKIYTIFDEEVSHVVETPNQVYFTSRNMQANDSHETFFSLFRYDKKGDELLALSTSNILNSNNVADVIYNPDKGYLAVVYTDFNIDLLHNNGKVTNIPYYKQASVSQSKQVNSLSVDPLHDRLYLATDFGYVALNDQKAEVAESRIYDTPLRAFARMGNTVLAVDGNRLLYADANSPRLSLDQYEEAEIIEDIRSLHPLSNDLCILVQSTEEGDAVKKIHRQDDGTIAVEDFFVVRIYNIENNLNGITIATTDGIHQIAKDGSLTSIKRNENYDNCAAGSENLSEIWNGAPRKGLSSLKRNGEKWSLTRDWMLPNVPAAYASSSFLNHPDLGLLVLGYGMNESHLNYYPHNPYQLSAYKQGRWKNLAPLYTYPKRGELMLSPTGMVLDPNNRNYLYVTSYRSGISRINLSDPTDIIHLSYARDGDHTNSGFAILPPDRNTSAGYWNITAPLFDKQGNMWMNFSNWDDTSSTTAYFYCWTPEDLKSMSVNNIVPPSIVEFPVPFSRTNRTSAIPLLKTGNGLIVLSAGLYNERLALIDTKGTPLSTRDDQVYIFPNFPDTDGNQVVMRNIRYIWEDPNTGYVWLCHQEGVCYFVPSQILNDNYYVNRVKVSRNDGTNLADYLLDGVTVNHMVADGEGRKWFATAGAGIICTTSDGREILEEFNTSNSPLPDDVVFGIGYNSASNSLMIATGKGFAEYFLPAGQSSSSKSDIRAYPNPVRPEYSGYVTITDIPQGSFVKIVDVAGNLIKDLGVMSGFEMLWDLSDSHFNRVRSGVYRIMVSPSDENGSYSTAGKILVVS